MEKISYFFIFRFVGNLGGWVNTSIIPGIYQSIVEEEVGSRAGGKKNVGGWIEGQKVGDQAGGRARRGGGGFYFMISCEYNPASNVNRSTVYYVILTYLCPTYIFGFYSKRTDCGREKDMILYL